jgi:tight adherence protein B
LATLTLLCPVPAATADGTAGVVVVADVTRSGQDVTVSLQVPLTAGETSPGVTVRLDGATLASTSLSGTGSAPRTAVLVLDASGSMRGGGIKAAKQAASAFSRTVAPDVRVGLVSFSATTTVLTVPTTDRGALAGGLTRLTAAGETALYDGVLAGARQAGPGGTLVVLSDGADTVSKIDLAQTLSMIRTGGVHADVVAFKTAESDSRALEQIAAAGGGRVVPASGAGDLATAFAAAARAVPVDVVVTTSLPDGRYSAATLELAVTSGRGRTVVSVPVPEREVVPQAPTPTQRVEPPATVTVAGTSSLLRLEVLAPAAFVALALAVWLAWPRPQTDADRRRRALKAYQVRAAADAGVWAAPGARPGNGGPDPGGGPGPAAVSAVSAGVLQASERLVAARGQESAIALRLDRAGMTLKPNEWIALRGSVAVVTAVTVALVSGHHVLGLIVGLVLGWLPSGAVLRIRQSRRTRAFADQLPTTLQLIASSLRSGFSLPQALTAAQENGIEPMASELGRSLSAARIGAVLEDELDEVAVRMRSEDWRWAVMAIRIQRAVGGNLAEVLNTTAKTLRDRAAMRRQVKALSAEGRLSAYILIALPIVVAAALMLFRREYLEPLWTTVPGVAMLLIAGLGMVVGWFWMRKVVEVEV